jgi:hypothetical protein
MKLSLSLTFRNQVASRGMSPDDFRAFVEAYHAPDIVFHKRYAGILSFDDSSWSEWAEYEDGSIDIWSYDKRYGRSFKTNPKTLRPL